MYKTLLFVLGLIVLFGCTQMGGKVVDEMGTCLDKCQNLCSLAKNNSFEFDGFQNIGLKKQTGGVSVSCNCPCY